MLGRLAFICDVGCQYYLAVYLDFDYGFFHVKVSKNFMSFLAYRYGVIVFSFRIEFIHFFLLLSIRSGFSFGFMK